MTPEHQAAASRRGLTSAVSEPMWLRSMSQKLRGIAPVGPFPHRTSGHRCKASTVDRVRTTSASGMPVPNNNACSERLRWLSGPNAVLGRGVALAACLLGLPRPAQAEVEILKPTR